jgi:serine/threonine-protein kinase
MATVYLARDLKHERDVAVKLMHPDLAAHMGPERFLHEIKIAANLTHPHIVPVYDSGSADGRLYYVMPYIDGESLRDRLEREGQLPLGDALAITRDVGEALAHAHSHGVVHRDIKPENILLSGDHALVADFGIARAVSVASEHRLTRTGLVLGTPLYMSPEQTAGSSEVDSRSDVYSLGCVLYEMLGGEPPFTGPTADGIARQHVHSVPRPITDLRATVPDTVSAAIAQALAKTPADRFSSAARFVDVLAGEAGDRAWPFRVRRRTAVLIAVPASLIAIAALIIGLSRDPPNPAPALDRNRVVVVPLENRTGDTALAVLGSLAADWIARGLQEIDVIEVVPTATAVNPGPDVASVAESSDAGTARAAGMATRAGTVVAGSYYRRADSLEFQTQVIDAEQERLLPRSAHRGRPWTRCAAAWSRRSPRRSISGSSARPPPAGRRRWRRTARTSKGIALSTMVCLYACARHSSTCIRRWHWTPRLPIRGSSSSWPTTTWESGVRPIQTHSCCFPTGRNSVRTSAPFSTG